MSMSNEEKLDKTKLLIIDTPPEYQNFILKFNLVGNEDEVNLSIIVDNMINLALCNVHSPENDTEEQIRTIVETTINELQLEVYTTQYDNIRFELYRLFENTYKLLLSTLIAHDCYDKFIYCSHVDIFKIMLEVIDKGKAWQ